MSWSGMYGQDENEQYKLPNLCARCGVKPREIDYEIAQTRKKRDFIFGNYKVNLHYTVALCNDCKNAVVRQKWIWSIVSNLAALAIIPSLAGFGLSLATLTQTTGSHVSLPNIIALGVVFTLSMILTLLGQILKKPRLSNFDGKYFRFRNKAYHDVFRQLNPAFVKPVRH